MCLHCCFALPPLGLAHPAPQKGAREVPAPGGCRPLGLGSWGPQGRGKNPKPAVCAGGGALIALFGELQPQPPHRPPCAAAEGAVVPRRRARSAAEPPGPRRGAEGPPSDHRDRGVGRLHPWGRGGTRGTGWRAAADARRRAAEHPRRAARPAAHRPGRGPRCKWCGLPSWTQAETSLRQLDSITRYLQETKGAGLVKVCFPHSP